MNIALQQVMDDYAGVIRSETLLRAGLDALRRLKESAAAEMIAKNQHEVGRCLEVLNLLNLGELVFIMAMDRRETRDGHIRTDYPFANPLMDKMLIVKKLDDRPVTEWVKIKG